MFHEYTAIVTVVPHRRNKRKWPIHSKKGVW